MEHRQAITNDAQCSLPCEKPSSSSNAAVTAVTLGKRKAEYFDVTHYKFKQPVTLMTKQEMDSLAVNSAGVDYDSEEEIERSDSEDDEIYGNPEMAPAALNTEVAKWLHCHTNSYLPLGENVTKFPATSTEFLPLTGQYKVICVLPLSVNYYQFIGGNGRNFYVAIDTLWVILQKKYQKAHGITIEVLADTADKANERKLIEELTKVGIAFEDKQLQKVCEWSTLLTISQLNVPFDLAVCGGGISEFDD